MKGRLLFTNGYYDCTLSNDSKEKLNKEVLEWLVGKTNRSMSQTKFLFNILGDWKLLLELEESIKIFHCYYCPGNYAECMYLIGKLRVWKSCGWIDESKFKLWKI
jgi:hypothetical protein